MTAKTERVRQSKLYVSLNRLIRRIVEVALLIRLVQVDSRRNLPVPQRVNRSNRLHRARRAEHMPGHRLRGTDMHLSGVLSEHLLKRRRLSRVIKLRSGSVRVEVNLLR